MAAIVVIAVVVAVAVAAIVIAGGGEDVGSDAFETRNCSCIYRTSVSDVCDRLGKVSEQYVW